MSPIASEGAPDDSCREYAISRFLTERIVSSESVLMSASCTKPLSEVPMVPCARHNMTFLVVGEAPLLHQCPNYSLRELKDSDG